MKHSNRDNFHVFIKACAVIYSCKHIGHIRTAVNYATVAFKNNHISEYQHNLLKFEYNKKLQLIVYSEKL